IARQLRGRLAEVVSGRRFGAKNTGAPFGNVQIDFENVALAPGRIERQRQRRFQQLAGDAATGPQKDIARYLHADGAGAAQFAAVAKFIDDIGDGIEIDTAVRAEATVLGCDHRALQTGADALERHAAVIDPALVLVGTDQHRQRDGGINKTEQQQARDPQKQNRTDDDFYNSFEKLHYIDTVCDPFNPPLATVPAGGFNLTQQFRRRHFAIEFLAEQLLQRGQQKAIVLTGETNRGTAGSGAAGAADAVDVIFGIFRQR